MNISKKHLFWLSLSLFALLVVRQLKAANERGGVEIRPLSDITADGPTITNLTATSATLDFISTIPVACSVVYGTDSTYGQIAVDPDMAGAAIIEHHPILGNLQPNTTYQYRLQGSAANGILYVSDVFTFTTPLDTNNEINLAQLEDGALILDVSSNFGGGSNSSTWGANKAIDNSENSAWASNGDGNDAYIEVQLTQKGNVQAISVWSREMADGTSRVIDFTVSSDLGETFSFTLPDAQQAYRFNTPFNQPATSIRLDVDSSTGGNVGLHDFDVLAPDPSSSQPEQNFLPTIFRQALNNLFTFQ